MRRCDPSDKEPEKSPAAEGQAPRLKPGTPEPDGDSNQERAKDRGTERTSERGSEPGTQSQRRSVTKRVA